MRLRKLAILAVCAIAVASGLGFTFVKASSVSTTPTHLAGCYNRLGINSSGHTAYDCLYVPTNDGALYFGQTKYIFWYYWHPAHASELVVTEMFFKPDLSTWPGAIPPTNNPLHNYYGGVPLQGHFNWRYVTLGDGCLVVAPTDTGAPPTTCTPTLEGGAIAGPTRAMTTAEQSSVNAFWQVVGAAVPDNAW